MAFGIFASGVHEPIKEREVDHTLTLAPTRVSRLPIVSKITGPAQPSCAGYLLYGKGRFGHTDIRTDSSDQPSASC